MHRVLDASCTGLIVYWMHRVLHDLSFTSVSSELCLAKDRQKPPEDKEADGHDGADGVQSHAEGEGACLHLKSLLRVLQAT